MAGNKKQHYVPRVYLSNFAVNEKLFVHNVKSNNILKNNVPLKGQCYTDYMYGKDLKWEKVLATYETEWGKVLKKIIQGDFLRLTNKEIISIKTFIVIQSLRTEHAVDNRNYSMFDVYKKILPIVAQMKGLQVNDEQVARIAKETISKEPRAKTVITLLKAAIEVIKFTDHLKLVLLDNSCQLEFISSDNPVIMENEFQKEYGRGIDCLGIWFVIPISPKYSLLMVDSKLYPKCNVDIIEIKDKSEIAKYNMLQYIYCREILYASNINPLKKTKTIFDNHCNIQKLLFIKTQLSKQLSTLCRDPILVNIAIENSLDKSDVDNIKIHPKTFCNQILPQLDLVTLHPRAIPFTDNMNMYYRRHTTEKERLERLMFMGIYTKTKRGRKELSDYQKFLFDYFNNSL